MKSLAQLFDLRALRVALAEHDVRQPERQAVDEDRRALTHASERGRKIERLLDGPHGLSLGRLTRRWCGWRATGERVVTVAVVDRDPEVDVIVLTGADPAFCAGLDLKQLGSGSGSFFDNGGVGYVIRKGDGAIPVAQVERSTTAPISVPAPTCCNISSGSTTFPCTTTCRLNCRLTVTLLWGMVGATFLTTCSMVRPLSKPLARSACIAPCNSSFDGDVTRSWSP